MALLDNLRAAYKLSDVNDYSGNGYNLTNTGTVTFGSGLVGNCAQFGNSNTTKKLDISSALGISTGDDITISYWAKDGDNATPSQAVELVYASGTKRFQILRDAVNTRWGLYGNSTVTFSSVGDGLTNNTWRHLCMVFTGGTATLYVDTVSTITHSPGSVVSSSDHFSLQNSFVDTGFRSGDIDALYVWNRALDATDRAILYNSGSGVEPSISSASSNLLLLSDN